MQNQVIITTTSNTGVITLNRPQAINALSRGMIDEMHQALRAFEADADIGAILIEGLGARGFCAGGDVRAIRDMMLAGDFVGSDGYFAAEYALNGAIAACSKPVVVMCDGAVMGGGIGLAGHAHFRIGTQQVRYAMPEGAIGFVPDIGVDAILAEAPRHRALAFLMSGQVVGAADALVLGLVDCIIPQAQMALVREELFLAIAAGDVATSITNVMQAHGVDAGETVFVDLADRLQGAFAGNDVAQIIAAISDQADGDDEIGQFSALLATRCPTTLVAAVVSHDLARAHRRIEDVLANDFKVACWMVRRPDFAEGVRAVLVDKDHKPSWQPDGLEKVDFLEIVSLFGK